MNIEQKIYNFIIEIFGISEDVLTNDTQLLESGIVDSTGVMEMVLFTEEEFAIEIPPEDLLPENFNSVSDLASYIRRRLSTNT